MGMTERELAARLLAAGFSIPVLTLSEWRRCGLMPPLASNSRGLNKGKVYYWAEEDVFERAILIHDLLVEGVERQELYWRLWLCGLTVPLPQLRRAWLHTAREKRIGINTAEADNLRSGTPRFAAALGHGATLSSQALLDIALWAGASVSAKCDPEIDALVEAVDCAMMGRAETTASDLAARSGAVRLLKTVWSALRQSDLIGEATDDELHETQRHVSAALRLFQQLRVRPPEPARRCGWPVSEAARLGAPLCHFVLILLKSGRRDLLERIALAMKLAEFRLTLPETETPARARVSFGAH